MQWDESLALQQILQVHVEEDDVERFQELLDVGSGGRPTTEREHTAVLGQHLLQQLPLQLLEPRPAQLEDELTRRQSVCPLHVVIEVTERDIQPLGSTLPHRALARAGRADEDQHGPRLRHAGIVSIPRPAGLPWMSCRFRATRPGS